MSHDIHQVLSIARQAGAEIMAMRAAVVANPEIKGDGSPVTLADKRASDIVMAGLQALTPDIPVISEEAPEAENRAIQASHDKYWIVDPLDGTRSYIDGYDGFGVHIGLIDKGVPVAGVVFFPALDTIYYTEGGKAWRQTGNGQPEQISVRPSADHRQPAHVACSWVRHRQPVDAGLRMVPAVGGARAISAAEGATELALIESPFSYWDIAAAHAVLRAAGGELFDLEDGQPVRYPSGRLWISPCLGGSPAAVQGMRSKVITALKAMSGQQMKKPKL